MKLYIHHAVIACDAPSHTAGATQSAERINKDEQWYLTHI